MSMIRSSWVVYLLTSHIVFMQYALLEPSHHDVRKSTVPEEGHLGETSPLTQDKLPANLQQQLASHVSEFFGSGSFNSSWVTLIWNSNTLATSWEELTHWKRPWCWEGLEAGGEGDDRGWDGWMASPTQWAWVWVNSGSLWWTGRPGVLRFMWSQRVGHNWVTELNWTESIPLNPGQIEDLWAK